MRRSGKSASLRRLSYAEAPASFARVRPSSLSFQQLLLVAFLLIGALLGAAAVRALFSLETLLEQSREGTAQAIALSTAAQKLGVQKGTTRSSAPRVSTPVRSSTASA